MMNLSVSTIQTNLSWEDKASNLQMLEEKIEALGPTEVVVLPEMFSTGFSMNPRQFAEPIPGPTLAWMQQVAARKKIIVTGSMMAEADGNYYNRLIWMLPNGNYGFYDKRHLFAYAGEHAHYTPGSRRLVTQVKGWKILMLICYDLRFPVWSRQQVQNGLPEYDAIIYVANWPDRRSQAWCSLLQARAIENQCYVVGVNRVGYDGNGIYHSGNSSVIDPYGEILYRQKDAEEAVTHMLERRKLSEIREKMPFWKDGDTFRIL